MSFADELDGLDLHELCSHIALEAMAEYTQTSNATHAALLSPAALPRRHTWQEMDEATIGMAGHAWLADIRGHAGYENLRLALVGPVRKCRPCDGIGSLHDGSRCAYAGERDACPDGVGCGTVPTPAAPTPA